MFIKLLMNDPGSPYRDRSSYRENFINYQNNQFFIQELFRVKDPTGVSGFGLMECPKLKAWFRSIKNAVSKYHAIGLMVNNYFTGGAKGFG